MDKAIVTGALGFLGFELCLAMLEEGLEVLAVDSKDETGERWLEVGRNSNITYQPMHRQMPEKDYKASVFINLYDYFTDKQGETMEQISRFLEKTKPPLQMPYYCCLPYCLIEQGKLNFQTFFPF
ncbi:NAD-dependent epimerase/dehydratase family protein [Bacillus sp. P14.5]|uniref:NAD-dependent epimerase/dehydratase family protein n=1 Tax=Bacillus sp. P14.5 TaxID=1983400 RepID=UPI000DEB35C6|nr:NAD-dependent epimerase/dehydratase family protein [Bacillus sp. P14.5]